MEKYRDITFYIHLKQKLFGSVQSIIVLSMWKKAMNKTPFARELNRQGLTIMQLAGATGIGFKYLYQLRDGTRCHPSWPYVVKIARALDVEPESIFPIKYGRR